MPEPKPAASRALPQELDLKLSALDDARVAGLLARVILPAFGAAGPARAILRSAIARLARADLGALSSRAVDLFPAAALAARTEPGARLRVRILHPRRARSR
jgi:hypothetical protein